MLGEFEILAVKPFIYIVVCHVRFPSSKTEVICYINKTSLVLHMLL